MKTKTKKPKKSASLPCASYGEVVACCAKALSGVQHMGTPVIDHINGANRRLSTEEEKMTTWVSQALMARVLSPKDLKYHRIHPVVQEAAVEFLKKEGEHLEDKVFRIRDNSLSARVLGASIMEDLRREDGLIDKDRNRLLGQLEILLHLYKAPESHEEEG